ncbi:hypothetical protein Esti_003652 [Eimeria stiedai]
MTSTYGWLTESALAIERPIPLRGVSQQSQLLLSEIVKKHQESQQTRLAHQRPIFAEAAKAGKVFIHDAECDRRWTRPTAKASLAFAPLLWAERALAARNDGVEMRSAADEAEGNRRTQTLNNIGSHLENKAKLYERIVGALSQSSSASLLIQLRQKRRLVQRALHSEGAHESEAELPSPRLSAEALTELLTLPEAAQQRATRLAFLQARLNLYRHILSGQSSAGQKAPVKELAVST